MVRESKEYSHQAEKETQKNTARNESSKISIITYQFNLLRSTSSKKHQKAF